MNDITITKRIQRTNTLPLKTAVIIAKEGEYDHGKKQDYPLYYIHGVIVYDVPYKEKYLLTRNLDFSQCRDGEWHERSELLTLKQIRAIIKDRKNDRLEKCRLALLAELDSLRGGSV